MSQDTALLPEEAMREESTAGWIARAQKAEAERDACKATADEALTLLAVTSTSGLSEEGLTRVRAFLDRNQPTTESREAQDITQLVSRFAAALREKLISFEAKYGWQGAWKRDSWANVLRKELRQHVGKGDPIDVAAYCAFAWHHGWSLAQPRAEDGLMAAPHPLQTAQALAKEFEQWV